MPRGFRDEDRRYNEDESDSYSFEGVQCIAQTPQAILVLIDHGRGSKREHWIPQSQVHDDSEVFKKGDEGKLVVKGWFTREKGLVCE